jgi:hypothetical protein
MFTTRDQNNVIKENQWNDSWAKEYNKTDKIITDSLLQAEHSIYQS